MRYIKRTNPVVVEDDSATRAEANLMAEERGKASGTVAVLGVLAVVVILLLVGYFAWWAPVNAAEANQSNRPSTNTTIIQKPVPNTGPPTIINNPPAQPPTIVTPPSNPPTIIQENVPPPTSGDTNPPTTSGDSGAGSTGQGG